MILKYDTDTTGNFIHNKDAVVLNNQESKSHGLCIRLTNNLIINPTKQGNIPLPNFPY